jgi:predicted phosphate transport protein (TIGR00153 family)
MFRWIPKEEKFFEMFIEMAKNAHEGAMLLRKMLNADDQDGDLAQSLKGLEHKGDLLTHNLLVKLNKTFIVPIDREDIYALSSSIDDVMDLIEAIARRKVLFKIKNIGEGSLEIAQLLFRATAEIVSAVSQLQHGQKVMTHCIELNRLEDEADHIYHEALGRLFDTETDPINLMKRKELIETLETAMDKCEDVANVIEGIIVKNA